MKILFKINRRTYKRTVRNIVENTQQKDDFVSSWRGTIVVNGRTIEVVQWVSWSNLDEVHWAEYNVNTQSSYERMENAYAAVHNAPDALENELWHALQNAQDNGHDTHQEDPTKNESKVSWDTFEGSICCLSPEAIEFCKAQGWY